MEIELIVDGEEIQMNDFVQKIIGNIIQGAVSSLNDIESNWKNLTLKVKR